MVPILGVLIFFDHSSVDFNGSESKGEQVSGEISDDDSKEEAQWTDHITDLSFLTSFRQVGLIFIFQITLST